MVNPSLLQLHAFAERLQISDFKASNEWFNRFKERHNMSLNSIQGESKDVAPKTVREQKEKIKLIF